MTRETHSKCPMTPWLWSQWGHVTNMKWDFFSYITPVTTKLDRMDTYNEGNPWPRGHMRSLLSWKQNISPSARLMATKFSRVVASDDRNSSIMSDDPLITWSHQATWQIENLICPVLRGLWPPSMGGWGLIVRGTHLWSHIILWQPGDSWSRDRLKRNISSLARLMAMKVVKLVTYGELNTPMKPHVLPNTWSHEVTWQTENKIWPWVKLL